MSTFPDTTDLLDLSIARIKVLIESTDYDEAIIEAIKCDPRAGVRAIARKLVNRKLRTNHFMERQRALCALEKEIRSTGIKAIAGVDEAGRGPLAGPVVAASVILPEDVYIEELDDSKKITAAKRDKLFDRIISEAVAWGIGMVDNEEIDNTGILKATMKAMRIAVANMKIAPDIVLVDGNRSPGLVCAERLVVDGDARCRSIAAASIIAKVTRDRIMIEMDKRFYGYGFAKHKGYGSREHVEALRNRGPCDIHRFSFKIVPSVSPEGTSSSVLMKRLLNAPDRATFESAVAGISRIKNQLFPYDIEVLRKVYRTCAKRFL